MTRGKLFSAVEDALNETANDVTATDVYSILENKGYEFEAENPQTTRGSILGVLNKLVEAGKATLVEKGAGRKPSTYRRIEV